MSELLRMEHISLTGLIQNLDLEVHQGQTLVIRTSDEHASRLMLKVLLGESVIETGRLLIQGVATSECHYEQLIRLKRSIGVISADRGLISNLKLWENIMLPVLYHHGAVSDEIANQAVDLLDRLGYSGNLWALPGHLTTSDRLIATFVRSCVSSAPIMVYTDAIHELQQRTKLALHKEMTRLHTPDTGPAAVFLTALDDHALFLRADKVYDLRNTNRYEA